MGPTIRIYTSGGASLLGLQHIEWTYRFAPKRTPLQNYGQYKQILITSRSQHWDSHAKTVPIDTLGRDESKELLTRRVRERDEQILDALADALEDLPLALEQAGAGRILGRRVIKYGTTTW